MSTLGQRVASYTSAVRAALDARKRRAAPDLARMTSPVLALLVLAIGVGFLTAPPDRIDFQFRDERGMVTALSAIALAMASAFAGAAFLLEPRGREHGLRAWWLLTCLGFFFLASDELLCFHEEVGSFLRREVLGRPRHVFRNWNDVIVILYGVVALALMVGFLPRVARLPVHPELLAIAFAAYVLHTLVDSIPQSTPVLGPFRASPYAAILEESAKLCASAFFATAMLAGLLLSVRTPPEEPPRQGA